MIQNREDGPSELLSSLRRDVGPNRNEATESGALAQWQRELERVYQDLRESTANAPTRPGRRVLEDGSEKLPSVEIVDNSSNAGDARLTPPGSEAPVQRGSPASHAYASRILSEAGGNGTAVARTLLRDLNTGTFIDTDGNRRHFLTQDESEVCGLDFNGLPQEHPLGTVYQGPAQKGELHMRSVINDVIQQLGENDPEQVARFNSECVRAFNAGETSYLFQIRNMTAEERRAADDAQEADSPLRGTYHRALIILQPSPEGTARVPGANGQFRQTDFIPEPDPHGTHQNE